MTLKARCCIAGGGPAGMMLGLLLARAGIETIVLEKHADFFRDFRGDTIHPSTLQVMHELGLLDEFLKLPHAPTARLSLQIGERMMEVADFSHLPTRCKFIAMMPQWDFLNFLATAGRAYPAFHLKMDTEATGLVPGGVATSAGDIQADLVVAADGRHSTLRAAAGLTPVETGAPMDVLWLRLSRQTNDPPQSMGRIEAGKFMIALDRGDYWQCAYVIPKGGIAATHADGLPAFRAKLAALMPAFANRVDELKTWDDVKLLTVAVNRLTDWCKPGLLFIGDAAHAMSPVGGVGVNLAIQDAVAAANILVPKFRMGTPTLDDLRAVQRRREPPTIRTQRLQIFMQNRIISPVLAATQTPTPPLGLRLMQIFPVLRRIPARLIGMGFQPEHIAH